MISQEQVGAVPQAGVNPLAKQQTPQPAQAAAPQGGAHQLPPEQLKALRTDPEIAEAVAKFMGKPMDLAQVPDDLLVQVAGMVQKLGVDGAVAEFQRLVPPEVIQQLRSSIGAAQ